MWNQQPRISYLILNFKSNNWYKIVVHRPGYLTDSGMFGVATLDCLLIE